MLKAGLKPLSEDKRDFPLGALGAIPSLEDVKPTGLSPRKILNQIADGNDDFCTSYAVAGALSITEETDLFPDFQMAASLELNPSEWGQELRPAMKATTIYGIPNDQKKLPKEQRKDFSQYTQFKKEALYHKQKTYFKTSGKYDPADNVIAWLSAYKHPIIMGVNWGWSLQDRELTGFPDGFGHCIYAIDFTPDRKWIKVVNSAGIEAGDNGIHMLSRETANDSILKFGAYMHVDVTKEEAQASVEMYRSNTSWWWKILTRSWH